VFRLKGFLPKALLHNIHTHTHPTEQNQRPQIDLQYNTYLKQTTELNIKAAKSG
jgi:hypothetical protein